MAVAATNSLPGGRLSLAIGFSGEHYAAIFGCNQSGLEAVLLKRRVMIPCWISLKHPTRIEAVTQVILRSKRFLTLCFRDSLVLDGASQPGAPNMQCQFMSICHAASELLQ